METSKQAEGKSDEAATSARKWSAEERELVVRASQKRGTTVNAVAKWYEVKPWQVYDWRKRAR